MSYGLEADVVILHCRGCNATTPRLILSADTDMGTNSLGCLSSIERDEVIAAPAEPRDVADDSGTLFAARVSAAMGRHDLRYLGLLRVEGAPAGPGASFSTFRATYEPPLLVFRCPHCGSGEAAEIARHSVGEYRRRGGKVTVMADGRLAG